MKKLTDLTVDPHNANAGTDRGREMVGHSLKEYGAGRSVLADKNGVIIAGNQTVGQAAKLGMEDIILVPTDGTKLVVVQRTDLDAADPKARELAIADNRTAEVGLDWKIEELHASIEAGADIGAMFTSAEMEELASVDVELPEYEEPLKAQTFVRVLVSVPTEKAIDAKDLLDQLGSIQGIEVDYGAN
jgi:hypothetical protein